VSFPIREEDTIDWKVIATVDHWLDENVDNKYKTQPLAQDWARIAKVIEELGEVIRALIAYTGQNPRKPIDHVADMKMLEELCDTALTSILALQHFTKDTGTVREMLRDKQVLIYQRMMNVNDS